MSLISVEWNGFIKMCCENYPAESCAFLFAKAPFKGAEKWFVFPVENIAVDKVNQWSPHPQELKLVKEKAKDQRLTPIGNVHSHTLPESFKTASKLERGQMINEHMFPSDVDLRYARRFNNIVRGILVVDDNAVYECYFHDQFGVNLDLYLNGITEGGSEK